MQSFDPRKILIDTLMEHPEGLTLVSLAEISGLHRHTATKYIHELLGAGIVMQRSVGAAKLCYLTEKVDSTEDENRLLLELEERRNGARIGLKVLTVVAIMSFLMSETVILAYQNVSTLNETNLSSLQGINTSPMTASNYPNSSPNGTSLLNISTDEIVNLDENGNSTEKIENNTNSSVELLEQILQEINESTSNTANTTGSLEGMENETQELNEDVQIEENNSDSTTEIPNSSETPVNDASERVLRDLKLSLEYPARVARGEPLTVKATVFNADNLTAETVNLLWTVPAGFELVSGSIDAPCGTLGPQVSCVREITLKTDLSTVLGINKIRVVVDYE